MRSIAYDALLFYVALNLACVFITQTGILPGYQVQPASDPSGMAFWTDASTIIMGGVAGIISIIVGHLLFGGALLVLTALGFLFKPLAMLINGFPVLIANLGLPTPIYIVVQVLVGFIFLMFIIEFLSGRQVS